MVDAAREPTFQLYFRMARNAAFELPDELDRIKALKWIRRIDNERSLTSQKARDHAILLLLHALNRKQLVGPFEKMPDEGKLLTDYKWNIQPEKMTQLILNKEFEKFGQPPISIDISGDLCEIVTYQEIPLFGAHFYYAFSPEKIQKWDNLDTDIIPKGLLAITVVSRPDLSILNQELNEKTPPRKKVKIITDKSDKDFTDITVLDTSGHLKDNFVGEQPPVEGVIDTEVLEVANKSGIVTEDELRPDADMA